MNGEKLKVKSLEFVRIATRSARLVVYLSLFTFQFSIFTVIAQDDSPDAAPPPLKTLSKNERSSLDSQSGIKERTKIALTLMGARLIEAERLNAMGDFDGMFRELGGFHGLMDNSLLYLQERDVGSGKVLDNFKRIEIGLRGFAPRLEAIRRDLPLRYEGYLNKLLKYVRDARSKAIEPLFADTVLPVRKPD